MLLDPLLNGIMVYSDHNTYIKTHFWWKNNILIEFFQFFSMVYPDNAVIYSLIKVFEGKGGEMS